MREQDLKISKRFARLLKKELGKVEAILYGSRAKGGGYPDSDFDVCVIVEKLERKTRDKVLSLAWEIGFESGVLIAPLIFSRREWENSPLLSSPIYKNIRQEGIKL